MDVMKTTKVAIADIIIGTRVRRDNGDLDDLAGSMKSIGLLAPIVLNGRKELVAGGRRIAAAQSLGWDHIQAVIADTFDDAIVALVAERDENTCRKPLSRQEMVEVGRRLEEFEKPKAEERKASGRKKGAGNPREAESAPRENKGKTADKVAEAVGTSRDTYTKAKAVVEAAEADPQTFGDLPEKMDTESVNAAHKELKKRQEEPASSVKDKYGIPVQPHAAEVWQALPHFKELIRKVRELQKEFAALTEMPGGVHLQNNGRSAYKVDRSKLGAKEASGHFQSLALVQFIRDLEDSMPTYSVCPWQYADKPHPSDCKTCRGLNWAPPLVSGALSEVIIKRVQEAHGAV